MATNLPQTEEDLEEPRDPNQQTKLSFASKTRTDQKLEAIYKDELVISSDVVSERVTLVTVTNILALSHFRHFFLFLLHLFFFMQ